MVEGLALIGGWVIVLHSKVICLHIVSSRINDSFIPEKNHAPALEMYIARSFCGMSREFSCLIPPNETVNGPCCAPFYLAAGYFGGVVNILQQKEKDENGVTTTFNQPASNHQSTSIDQSSTTPKNAPRPYQKLDRPSIAHRLDFGDTLGVQKQRPTRRSVHQTRHAELAVFNRDPSGIRRGVLGRAVCGAGKDDGDGVCVWDGECAVGGGECARSVQRREDAGCSGIAWSARIARNGLCG